MSTHPDTEAIVGCYVLHLYCTHKDHPFPRRDEFTGHNMRAAIKDARTAGWIVSIKEKGAICPLCAKGSHD